MLYSSGVSDCGRYRYWLTRVWDNRKPKAVFVLAYPTVDAIHEDTPQVRACIKFAAQRGFGGVHILYIFALKIESRCQLNVKNGKSIGPDNDKFIIKILKANPGFIVCCWGWLCCQTRVKQFLKLCDDVDLLCFGTLASGDPVVVSRGVKNKLDLMPYKPGYG